MAAEIIYNGSFNVCLGLDYYYQLKKKDNYLKTNFLPRRIGNQKKTKRMG